MKSLLWTKGKPIDHRRDNTRCGAKGCRKCAGIREFDFGFFCEKHFFESPECTEDGCNNPVHVGPHHGLSGGRCRSCEFDYEGQLEIYTESALGAVQDTAIGRKNGHIALRTALDRAIEKNGIHKPDPRKNWFPGGR